MSGEVPEGWTKRPLQEVAKSFAGGTPARGNPANYGPGIPWLKSGEVRAGRILDIGETITETGLRNSSARIAKSGTPVIAMYGATAGVAGILGLDAAINQAVLAVVPDQHHLGSEFCYRVLDSQTGQLLTMTQGSGQPNLSKGLIDQLMVLLPPLEEQQRIAEVLRSVDERVAKERALLGQYQAVYDGTMSAFLATGNDSDNGLLTDGWITGRVKAVRRIPKGWRIRRLVEVAKLESGHTPSRTVEAYWKGGDIGWISLHDTKNLERRKIQETTLKITAAGVANSSARILPKGTVCLSRTASVGKCVIMGKPMTTSQDFANFVCSPALNNRYLLHLFRWMGPIWKALSSGSTHKTIYMPTFEALQIVVPPIDAQESVADALDAIASAIELSSEHLEALVELRRSIASDLLSGRVRVPA